VQHLVTTHTGVPRITLTSTTGRQTFHLLYQLPQSVECARSEHGAMQGHNCQNPNSTNNSIELNLRLDYILTP
jgi:hypothetical protein